jgi:rSAM/selenodomain-associated transferase 1
MLHDVPARTTICHYLLFARLPVQGSVKTRLAATLGAEKTLTLYEAMLRDTVEIAQSRASATNAEVLIFLTPSDDSARERFRAWLRSSKIDYPFIAVLPQEGATLGERMLNAVRVAESRDALPALLMGTDSPSIPDNVFTHAENALRYATTAVLGKTDDGGFYMMGIHKPDESLFFGADYSNDTVFDRTYQALQSLYPYVELLPSWYDIDDATSLERYIAEAKTDDSLRYFHTTRVLASWGLVFDEEGIQQSI